MSPAVAMVRRSDAGWTNGSVTSTVHVAAAPSLQLDIAPWGRESASLWLVCLLGSTDVQSAQQLVVSLADAPVGAELDPSAVEALPGPVSGAVYSQPLAVGIPL